MYYAGYLSAPKRTRAREARQTPDGQRKEVVGMDGWFIDHIPQLASVEWDNVMRWEKSDTRCQLAQRKVNSNGCEHWLNRCGVRISYQLVTLACGFFLTAIFVISHNKKGNTFALPNEWAGFFCVDGMDQGWFLQGDILVTLYHHTKLGKSMALNLILDKPWLAEIEELTCHVWWRVYWHVLHPPPQIIWASWSL